MSKDSKKVFVIPCSGIGKAYGLVGRQVALQVVHDRLPEETETMCLAYLVTGDAEANARIKGAACITLDGCAKLCAAKNVAMAGGKVIEEVRVVDAFKTHRGENPGTATKLTPEGWNVVNELTDQVVAVIRNELKGAVS